MSPTPDREPTPHTAAGDGHTDEVEAFDLVRCRICGCTDDRACPGGCVWVPDPEMLGELCSACAHRATAADRLASENQDGPAVEVAVGLGEPDRSEAGTASDPFYICQDLEGLDRYRTSMEGHAVARRYQGGTSGPVGDRGRFIAGDEAARFWQKVNKTGPACSIVGSPVFGSRCWVWTSVTTDDGYGHFRIKRAGHWIYVKAHRWSYEALVEPIPAGMTLDHLCRTRACVRPDHLEPVSHAENVRRAADHRRRANTSTP